MDNELDILCGLFPETELQFKKKNKNKKKKEADKKQ